MTRVVQITDTHLSAGKPQFAANWPPLADWIAAQHADLVIHTGDVTVDGADQDDDLQYCAGLLAALPVPVLTVPGNHDVGEPGHPYQPVDHARIERWRTHFGPDWWLHDLEQWRLVGLDSMLFGSGLPEEAEQAAWLEQILPAAGGRRLAVFTHRPLFVDHPEEPDTKYWSVKPDQRRWLLALLDRYDVAVVATGHLHRAHGPGEGTRRYVWGGAAGFLVGPSQQPPMPGHARLGAVVYDFGGREVAIAHAEVPGLDPIWIDDVIQDVYPPRPAAPRPAAS